MNDTISRKAAIEAVEKHLNGVLDGTHYDEGIAFGYEAAHRHIQEVIRKLPSAQLEWKVGKWIKVKNKWGGLEIKCSECGGESAER